ncbi:MAG: hypothetical protein Q8K92_26470, partial [Leadbetterella sp.]|nr:hypothetical protein [Leadbetterella sp.]
FVFKHDRINNSRQRRPKYITSFSISPSVGYFLSDQWAVGIETSYRNGQNKQYSYSYNINPIKLLSK